MRVKITIASERKMHWYASRSNVLRTEGLLFGKVSVTVLRPRPESHCPLWGSSALMM